MWEIFTYLQLTFYNIYFQKSQKTAIFFFKQKID